MIKIRVGAGRTWHCTEEGAVTIETNGIEDMATSIQEMLFVVQVFQKAYGSIPVHIDPKLWKGVEGK